MSKEAQIQMWNQGYLPDSGIQSGFTTATPSMKGGYDEDDVASTHSWTFEWETGFGSEHMDTMNDQFTSTRT